MFQLPNEEVESSELWPQELQSPLFDNRHPFK